MRKKKQTNKQASTLAQILHSLFLKISPGYYSRRKKNWRHCLRSRNFVWGRRGAGTIKYLYYETCENDKRRLAGVRFSSLSKTFSLHVFFLNVFLSLMCPFWSGVGYDFRGNYWIVWMYLWFQFQMSKNEFEMDFKKSFLLLLWLK